MLRRKLGELALPKGRQDVHANDGLVALIRSISVLGPDDLFKPAAEKLSQGLPGSTNRFTFPNVVPQREQGVGDVLLCLAVDRLERACW